MAGKGKKRQTFAKMTREQAVKERRARKQEKKDQRKEAAATDAAPEAVDGLETSTGPEIDEDEVRRLSRLR